MTTDPHVYKHGYAFLFSRPDYVKDLLESFVDKEFADSLDFGSFQALSEKHYLDKERQLDYLPPVFPILLYNGDKPWNATDSIQNLIENHDFLKQNGAKK
jgi:hypothetical protein